MPDALPIRGSVWEDSGCSLMARIVGNDGEYIVQADISAITYEVWETVESGGTEVVDETSLTVANVIFDTLQTDSRWHVDEDGYNFRFEAPAASFPAGNKTYLVEVKFTPTSGAAYHVVFQVAAKALSRS